ncbi:unnamed protein product [Phytophthora lilii]|uniref:Unnamed protein product n=1 Tax=Phytophthora lilii TaxID=2077276 RepID=A0A9W6TI60_9STRA|nr:unnamed protein product [Phytophthora lilii]
MAYTDCDLTNDLEIKSFDKPQEIFAESKKQCAWWKCTHAPKETKAIRWYGRGKTEISVDEDAFAPEDIESFAAIAQETVKPQAERILTEAQRLS